MAKATPREVYEPDEGPTFHARHPGRCAGCKQPFSAGDPVYFSDRVLYAAHGCEPSESDGADFDSFNRGRPPGIAVIPVRVAHSRTDLVGKRGVCPECFEIPASNGACAAHCSRSGT